MAGARKIRSAGWQGWKHRIPIHAGIGKRGNGFEVCVNAGLTGAKKNVSACGWGSNPRVALADALQRAGAQVRKRSGTFARYR